MKVVCVVFFLIASVCGLAKEKIVILPFIPNKYHILENPKHPNPSVAVFGKLKYKLEEMGFDVYITEVSDKSPLLKDPSVKYFIWQNPFPKRLAHLTHIPKDKSMLWLWEPKTVMPGSYSNRMHQRFKRVYTWDDTLVDGVHYFKFNYPHLQPMQKKLTPFCERKFCCLINANKHARSGYSPWKDYYAERRKVLQFFANLNTHELDLFGKGWGSHPLNRGTVPDKFKALGKYKFCICYENTNTPGYVTEKILDCFTSGTVPVYLGAENITEIIPERCYINRRNFDSDLDLYNHLKSVDEDTFNTYLENIRAYLDSEEAKIFSQETLVQTFVESILQ